MRKLPKLSTLLLTTLLIGRFWISSSHPTYAGEDHESRETTQVVVKLNPLLSTPIEAINAQYGTTTIEVLLGSHGIYLLRVPSGGRSDNVANEMGNDERLLYVEPNYLGEAPEGDGRRSGFWGGEDVPPSNGEYAHTLVNLAAAHVLNRGAGIVVAVLDTGLQMDHPALVGHLTTAQYDFVDDDSLPSDEANEVDDDGDGFTDEAFGHGTHVAGIVNQVAPDAQIMPLRVLNSDGQGNIFLIAEAILYAAEHGADVINLSLGSTRESDLLEDIVKDVIKQYDVVVVAAAGNLDSDEKQFPAAEDEVLAVTSIGETDLRSTFANYGEWVDVAAPGESIHSPFPVSDYAWWSGTSMSAPFVAGQAALIRSAVPTMNAAHVRSHIRSSSQSINAQNPGYNGELGRGRIDIGASIEAMCSSADRCQEPDQTGQVELEARGFVESRPQGTLSGTWVVNGITIVADNKTEFDQEDGALLVGACADIEYLNTTQLKALKIRTRSLGHCQETVTPTPSSTATSTLTPTATAESTPTPSLTVTVVTVLPTETPLPVNVTPTPIQTGTAVFPPTATPNLTPTEVETPIANTIEQGQVQEIAMNGSNQIWTINGFAYLVTNETRIDGNVNVGTDVTVESYVNAQGQHVVVKILATGTTQLFLPLLID